jgi:hypothetical protein
MGPTSIQVFYKTLTSLLQISHKSPTGLIHKRVIVQGSWVIDHGSWVMGHGSWVMRACVRACELSDFVTS